VRGNRDCIKILQHIVKSMDLAKSKILVEESIMPDNVGTDQDRLAIIKDIQMLLLFNGKERTKEQWRKLMSAADRRLEVQRFWQTGTGAGYRNAIIEVALKA
jgi:O-methyltransferase domain